MSWRRGGGVSARRAARRRAGSAGPHESAHVKDGGDAEQALRGDAAHALVERNGAEKDGQDERNVREQEVDKEVRREEVRGGEGGAVEDERGREPRALDDGLCLEDGKEQRRRRVNHRQLVHRLAHVEQRAVEGHRPHAHARHQRHWHEEAHAVARARAVQHAEKCNEENGEGREPGGRGGGAVRPCAKRDAARARARGAAPARPPSPHVLNSSATYGVHS